MDAMVSKRNDQDRLSLEFFDWSLAARNNSFKKLIAHKRRRIWPAIAVYFTTYIGLSALAAFAPGIMSIKLLGAFSFGYAAILFTYLVAWSVALWYVRIARIECDPLKQSAVASIQKAECAR